MFDEQYFYASFDTKLCFKNALCSSSIVVVIGKISSYVSLSSFDKFKSR